MFNFLAHLAEFFIYDGQNDICVYVCMCVCVCVWMLTRVEQIITTAHRDL